MACFATEHVPCQMRMAALLNEQYLYVTTNTKPGVAQILKALLPDVASPSEPQHAYQMWRERFGLNVLT